MQTRLDNTQADLANETRLRMAAEELEQRLQRRIADVNAARDDALSRRDAVSRQLESALDDLRDVRSEAAQLRASIAESESTEQTLQLRLSEARSERDHAVESRDELASKFDETTGALEAAQRVGVQLRARIAELENKIVALEEGHAAAVGQQQDPEINALHAEIERLGAKTSDLEDALGAANREKTRLEQRLVGAENRAAFSELEGVGYRSKFSSMAKQFFEQEVARQTDAQDSAEYESHAGDDPKFDRAGSAAILDAMTQLRQ